MIWNNCVDMICLEITEIKQLEEQSPFYQCSPEDRLNFGFSQFKDIRFCGVPSGVWKSIIPRLQELPAALGCSHAVVYWFLALSLSFCPLILCCVLEAFCLQKHLVAPKSKKNSPSIHRIVPDLSPALFSSR